MILNIFVSSTVEDLRYLRDGLRDAIEELAYNPVLSEYGGVGYLNPATAAESCVASVQQCQMMVLVIGKRYGSASSNDLSVTHNEMLKAREMRIPINAHYRKLVEILFGNIDVAVQNVMESATFDEVIQRAGAKMEIVNDDSQFKALIDGPRTAPSPKAPSSMVINAQWGTMIGHHAIFGDRRIVMDDVAKRQFDARQQQLWMQIDRSV